MKTFRLISLLTLTSLILSCSVEVKTVYNQKTDFKKFKTFCWMDGCGELPAAKGKEAETSALLKSILEKKLSSKGLTRVSGNPDLLIAVRLSLKDENAMVYRRNDEMPLLWPTGTDAQSIHYTKGTIVVAMADASAGNLVWESVAVEYLDDQKEANEQNLEKGIRRLLIDFPPDTQLKARRTNAVY